MNEKIDVMLRIYVDAVQTRRTMYENNSPNFQYWDTTVEEARAALVSAIEALEAELAEEKQFRNHFEMRAQEFEEKYDISVLENIKGNSVLDDVRAELAAALQRIEDLGYLSYDLSRELEALNAPMPCGHEARYAVNSDEGTAWCALCELKERQP